MSALCCVLVHNRTDLQLQTHPRGRLGYLSRDCWADLRILVAGYRWYDPERS